MPPESLLGPVGVAVGALIVVGVLWREHLRADDEDRKQRDDALAANRKLEASVAELARAIETDTRDRANRRRTDDR